MNILLLGVVEVFLGNCLLNNYLKINKVSVITSKFSNQKSYEIDNNVEIFRVPVLMRSDKNAATIISMLSFFPACLMAGYRLKKNRKFDIVHSMFAIPSAPAGLILAKKFKRTPYSFNFRW